MAVLLLFVTIGASAALWLHVRWSTAKRYWSDKQVPHLPPHLVFGSLSFLLKDNAVIWLRNLNSHFRSPYFGIWLFWRPALVINCPELARRVLHTDAHVFRDRFISAGESDVYGSMNLFTINDPQWSAIRRQLTPIFTSAKLRAVQHLVSSKAKELVKRIDMERDKREALNLRDIYTDYTTDIISIAAFGLTSEATLTGNSSMKEVTRDFMRFTLHRALACASIFFFPELTNIFQLTFFPKKTTRYFKKIFTAAVSQRGGYDNPHVKTEDLLGALMTMKRRMEEGGEEISEDLLVAQAAIFIQGGVDTAAVSITYTTYELAFAPQVQDKLYKELSKMQDMQSNLDAVTLQDLPYLNCVLKETLRKYPGMGWIDRVAANDYKINGSLTIAAGTPVYVNAAGMHYNPEYFSDPEEYIPDRFLPENDKNIKPFTYMPFGDGPRHCIGQRFAQLMIRFAVAAIVLNFELRPFPNSPKPRDCPTEKRGVLLAPRYPLSVEFVPRVLNKYMK